MSIHSEYDRNILVHYGVKGMKWGKHLKLDPEKDDQSESGGGGGEENDIFDEDEEERLKFQEEQDKYAQNVLNLIGDIKKQKKDQELIGNTVMLLKNIDALFKNPKGVNQAKAIEKHGKQIADTATAIGKAVDTIKDNNKRINSKVTNSVRSVQTIANKTRQMQNERNIKKYGKPIAKTANAVGKAANTIRDNNKRIKKNVADSVHSTQTIANRAIRGQTEKNVKKYGKPIADTATAIGKAADTIRENKERNNEIAIESVRELLDMLTREQIRRRNAR